MSVVLLTLLHSERPKLYAILAFPSAIGLSDGQGAVRQAILYAGRFCSVLPIKIFCDTH